MEVFVEHLVGMIENSAPRVLAEDWDNVGLLVGNPSQPVSRVAVVDIGHYASEALILAAWRALLEDFGNTNKAYLETYVFTPSKPAFSPL